MLDTNITTQLKSVFADLTANYTFSIASSPKNENFKELTQMLNDIAECSDNIDCKVTDGNGLEFSLLKDGIDTGVKFRGIPNGHEFTSLLLAILNSDGKGKNIPDEGICNRIKTIKGPVRLSTYVSLTCTNCPDVVQALNLIAILNDNITHEMVDGAINQEEVRKLNIQGVPSVFANGELLHVGLGNLANLLEKLEQKYGNKVTEYPIINYDMIVIGGGPAGASAAIYSARKGLNVAVIAERTGGQVKETMGIENLISIPKTTGEELASNLKRHIGEYSIDMRDHRRVERVEVNGKEKIVYIAGGERFSASALIIATGAGWRKLNIPGESEYLGRGVAFCPHCDGPFYKGKHVAVVGGGNSGIEAAIDLAGICSKVTVLEFMDELKADSVLQDKVRTLSNVEIFLSSQATKVEGNGEKVVGISVKNRKSEQERLIELDGIFVQIGLVPNSSAFKDLVTTNRIGEIEIDSHNRTNQTGVYAAGDVTTIPYKQIIIAMGEGAKSALSAFEERIKGVI